MAFYSTPMYSFLGVNQLCLNHIPTYSISILSPWLPVHYSLALPAARPLRLSSGALLAVQRFARETGDIHSLSAVDLKLLALTHTLEQAAHGSANLREHPVQVSGPLHGRAVGSARGQAGVRAS